ncbi:LIM domain-binding protein 3-like isoform X1 [Battus philenor]|uniref:LIM domain-binding protein 3-like isoform X1 n=1 Tax=Battus philenor TaxID=42288 RepID=UPI0035CF43E8
MAQLITVRLNKSDQQPLGFRLQGGKDFGTPLVVQKVNGGSAAERAGLQAGDAVIRVNNTDVYNLRHQEAQDAIRAAGVALELTVQRGGSTWRPSVTPTGSLPRPGTRPLGSAPAPVTTTSLKATPQPSRNFGSGHNSVAKPFGYMNGNDSGKGLVNKQYNSPVSMYSDKTIAETLSAQTEVLAGGVLGVNFKKNEKTYDAEKSAVFKVLQEEQNDPEPEACQFYSRASVCRAGSPGALHVSHARSRTPRVEAEPRGTHKPSAPRYLTPEPAHRPSLPLSPRPDHAAITTETPICSECSGHIIGVFVRIKDKNLHVECFKCSTCGSSLKNQGYYNLNGKLYCDIHAKLVARQNPPAPNLEPVTVPPGSRVPSNTYTTPLPPLATNNYTNGSSSMFSPSSNLSGSGPKPFGSSLGSAYSPSLSPRSAPMSPARPVAAPVPPPGLTAPAPFAPINETQIHGSPAKSEFKSQAEERLIRKMAKMALNGYEIGIQRKIKPADHIQSMANKIQDTVVTKHPLNSDTSSTENNSRENTLRRTINKSFDDIRKTSENNFINSKNTLSSAKSLDDDNGYPPIPPPIPTTPVPTLDLPSTSILNTVNMKTPRKQTEYALKSSDNNLSSLSILQSINNSDKSSNGSGYSSSNDDMYKEKPENNITNGNILRKKTSFEKPSFLDGLNTINQDVCKSEIKTDNNYSNTLNKRKIFERHDDLNNSNETYKNKVNNDWTGLNQTNTLSKSPNAGCSKSNLNNEEFSKKLSNNLYDNALNVLKPINTEKNISSTLENVNGDKEYNDIETKSDNTETETVVKRREKKKKSNDDGRRDSRIVLRPLSTMTSVDVAEGQYPVCHICDKAITRGPFITALGRIWCPEHFVCVNATCRRQLQDIGFVEENGQLYCEFCFEQYIAPACDKCHAKIKGDCLNAIGKHFHPECFNCVYCGKLFGNNPFFLEDGLPYCETDWNELFTTKCFACGFPVEAGDRWVEALNNNYHSQCFNCTVCKTNLEGQSFFARGGRPYCRTHAR